MKINGIVQNKSRKRNCLVNAMMEIFFGIMKTELFYLCHWNTIYEFKREHRKHIHYYNYDRIKTMVKRTAPVTIPNSIFIIIY